MPTAGMRGVAVALAVALLGCAQLRGGEDRYLNRSVTPSEVVGTWTATADSLDRLKAHGYQRYIEAKHHRIRLNADGTCEFRSLSNYFDPKSFPTNKGEEASYVDYTAGTCSWKLDTNTAYVRHTARTVPVVAFQADVASEKGSTSTLGWHLFLYEESGRLVLWTYIGDADYRRYMDFVKTVP